MKKHNNNNNIIHVFLGVQTKGLEFRAGGEWNPGFSCSCPTRILCGLRREDGRPASSTIGCTRVLQIRCFSACSSLGQVLYPFLHDGGAFSGIQCNVKDKVLGPGAVDERLKAGCRRRAEQYIAKLCASAKRRARIDLVDSYLSRLYALMGD